jgi:diguanylate cyclase (GGDEF)-like protein
VRGITDIGDGNAEATERIALNLAPFAAAAALAAVVAPMGTNVDWVQYAAAIGLGVLAGLVRLTPWPRALGGRELLPSLIFLIAVAFLRSATGGTGSGIAVMAMLPVFWTALHGDRRQLCMVTAGVTLLFLAPLIFLGGRAYPQSQYRAGVLFVAVSTIVGFTTQRLVAAVRHKAGESQAAMVTLIEQEAAAANERAELLSRLTDLASTDALTGLPNRRTWDVSLAESLARGEPFVLAMLDFDHFKDFNDTHGHPAGDRLLKQSAAGWREELRAGDVLARIGGEEFALLLPKCAPDDALMVVDRLRRRVDGEQTCSAGIVVHSPGETAETLMARVDEALYEAKAAGRDRVSLIA